MTKPNFIVFFLCALMICSNCKIVKIKLNFEQENSGYLEVTSNTHPEYISIDRADVSELRREYLANGLDLEMQHKDSFIIVSTVRFNNFHELRQIIKDYDGNDSFRIPIWKVTGKVGLNVKPSPVKRGLFWDTQEVELEICQDKHIDAWDHWSGKLELVMPYDISDVNVEETEKDIPRKIQFERPSKNTLFIFFKPEAEEDPRDSKKWYTIRVESSKFNLDWKEGLGIIATIVGIWATLVGLRRKKKE